MMILAIIGLILNQITVFFEVKSDVSKQKRGIAIKHGESALFRGLAWTIYSIATHWNDWTMVVLYGLLLGSTYWLTFDQLHNHQTGKVWYYTNKGPTDSVLSGFDNRYKRLSMKIALVLIFGLIYFS